jgi:hypothetical protein
MQSLTPSALVVSPRLINILFGSYMYFEEYAS